MRLVATWPYSQALAEEEWRAWYTLLASAWSPGIWRRVDTMPYVIPSIIILFPCNSLGRRLLTYSVVVVIMLLNTVS